MKLSIICICVTAVILLTTTTIFGQKVQVNVDKTFNFANVKTYAWDTGHVSRNPYVGKIIIEAVESALAARGLTKSDTPDIKVAVVAATGADVQAVGPSWNNVNYAMWGGYRNPAALLTVINGTMLLDLIDTKNGSSVFRGVAKETLNHAPSADAVKDSQRVEKLVKKAVTKMFKQYPTTK
jgi:hypothetical protein